MEPIKEGARMRQGDARGRITYLDDDGGTVLWPDGTSGTYDWTWLRLHTTLED